MNLKYDKLLGKLRESDLTQSQADALYQNPDRERIEYPQETVITNFQSGHGFVKTSANGSAADDTSDFVKGIQSLKITTNGSANDIKYGKTSFTAFSLSSRQISAWIKVDDVSKLRYLWIYLSSDTSYTNRYVLKIDNDISQLKSGVWSKVTISFSESTTTGSPDKSAIVAIQLYAQDNGTGAVNINWGGLSSFPQPPEGICSLTFDDGWLSQYTEAKKKMDQYGYAGTAYVSKLNIDTTNYMTLSQCKEMELLDGWDISGHSREDLTALSASALTTELSAMKSWLISNGFQRGINHFAYPLGRWNDSVVAELRKYFTSARTIVNFSETLPPADYYRLRVLYVLDTTTTAAIATAVTDAIDNGEWLILVFHKIVTTTANEIEYSISNFGTVIDNIATQGIKVRTVSDVIARNNQLDKSQADLLYQQLSDAIALGETSSTAYRGDRGKTAYDHSQITGNPHGVTASDVGALTSVSNDGTYLNGDGTSDSPLAVDAQAIIDLANNQNACATLPNARYDKVAISTSTGAGDYDAYTVPAGKKVIVMGFHGYNSNGSNRNIYVEVYKGGVYQRLMANLAVTSGQITPQINVWYCFEAGEKLAVNVNGADVDISLSIVEFDNTANIKVVDIADLGASQDGIGNDILYTCPANKCAALMPVSTINPAILSGNAGVVCVNTGSTTVTLALYLTETDATATANSNRFGGSTSNAGARTTFTANTIFLDEGNTIIVNTNSAEPQYIYALIKEFDK